MTTTKNRLRLDYADMPDLQSALGGLTPGDVCTVEFELMVVSNDDKSLEGDIQQVQYETPDEKGKDSGSDTVEPTTEEPVMVVIAKRSVSSKKASKADKPDPDAASEDTESE